MKQNFTKFKYEILLVLIGISWLVLITFLMQLHKQTFLFGDSISYFLAAQEFYFKNSLNDHRPLVISIINGFPLLFGLNNSSLFTWSLLINLLSWFSTILLIFTICKKITTNKTAFYSAFLYVFCAGGFFINFHLLSESIFTFCLVLSIYLIQKHIETNKISFLCFAISLLILTVMIKPLSLLLTLLLLLFFYKRFKEIFITRFSVLIYSSLAVLFFQMYSLKQEYGNFTVSYIDSFTYYNYLGTRADCLKNNTVFIQGKNERYYYFSKLSNSEQKKIASSDFYSQIKTNPTNLLKAFFINLYVNSTKSSGSIYGCENKDNTNYFEYLKFFFKALSKIQNSILTIIGVLLVFYNLIQWRKCNILFKYISITLLYIFLISGISSDQGDRFHIVFYPLVILLFTRFFEIKKTDSRLAVFTKK